MNISYRFQNVNVLIQKWKVATISNVCGSVCDPLHPRQKESHLD